MRAALQRRTSDHGFALVELAVVAAILFILAGIVVFSVTGATNSGQQSACNTEKSTLASAEEAYYSKTGDFLPQTTSAATGDLTAEGAHLLVTPPSWYTVATSGKGATATYSVDVDAAGRAAGCS